MIDSVTTLSDESREWKINFRSPIIITSLSFKMTLDLIVFPETTVSEVVLMALSHTCSTSGDASVERISQKSCKTFQISEVHFNL